MPIDKDGNRAEMIVDPKSTISRLNIGGPYEATTKASMLKLERIVRDEYKRYNVTEPYELTDVQLKNLFLHARDFMGILGNGMFDVYNGILHNNDRESMLSVVEEIIYDRFRAYLTTDNEKRKYEIIKDLDKSIYKPVYDKVKFTYDGRPRTSEDPVMIAPMYIFMLSKIADTVLTTSSAKLNHFGIPIVTSKNDRYRLPAKNSPVRTQGETEGRIFAAYGGREFLAELKDLNTSIESHEEVYSKLLTNGTPTSIDTIIDRSVTPYGRERGLTILTSLWNSIGMELEYVPETQSEYEYEENSVEEYITDITNISDVDESDLAEDKE